MSGPVEADKIYPADDLERELTCVVEPWRGRYLTAEDVVGQRVLCPGCRQTVFASWPEGWDAHAAHRCGGVEGATRAARKASFKHRFAHLFR